MRILFSIAALSLVLPLGISSQLLPAWGADTSGSAGIAQDAGALISPVIPTSGNARSKANVSPGSGNMAMGAAAIMQLPDSILQQAGLRPSSAGAKSSTRVVAITLGGLRPGSTHQVAVVHVSCAGQSAAKGTSTTSAPPCGSGGGGSTNNGGSSTGVRALGSTCLSMSGSTADSGALSGTTNPNNSMHGKENTVGTLGISMLPAVRADAQGDASLITTISSAATFNQGYEIQVLSDASNHAVIGCGALHAVSRLVSLSGMHGSTASAIALVTEDVPVLNGQVHGSEVLVLAAGLQHSLAQADHIHAGTCATTGPVLFPLLTLVSDARGRAFAGTAIPTSVSLAGDSLHIHAANFTMEACGNITG